jgi:hypothetical protein
MFLDTRNKNMYGLGVGISTVFEIAEYFLVKGKAEPPHMVMTYIPSDVPWHEEQKYNSLGVGISTAFEISHHFLFKGDGTTPHSHNLHTIRCSLTLGTRMYIV